MGRSDPVGGVPKVSGVQRLAAVRGPLLWVGELVGPWAVLRRGLAGLTLVSPVANHSSALTPMFVVSIVVSILLSVVALWVVMVGLRLGTARLGLGIRVVGAPWRLVEGIVWLTLKAPVAAAAGVAKVRENECALGAMVVARERDGRAVGATEVAFGGLIDGESEAVVLALGIRKLMRGTREGRPGGQVRRQCWGQMSTDVLILVILNWDCRFHFASLGWK